jgi:protein CrcB
LTLAILLWRRNASGEAWQEKDPGRLVTYLWIALGGALGSVARYACANLVASWFGESFPWGTILVNISGSFVIGFFAALTGADGRILVSPDTRAFVMIGICGGYTTFSSFSLAGLCGGGRPQPGQGRLTREIAGQC